jgi:hypothetical protein
MRCGRLAAFQIIAAHAVLGFGVADGPAAESHKAPKNGTPNRGKTVTEPALPPCASWSTITGSALYFRFNYGC